MRAYTTETQRVVIDMLLCIEAVGKLFQLWEGSSDEDRNRMAHTLFGYIVFDLDQRRIVDFKLKPWMDQFLVLRAATAEDVAKYGKCDPGRIRGRIYDTPDRLIWATTTLLDRVYNQPTRDQIIHQRHAAGERTGDLAREYGLSAARVSQIISGHSRVRTFVSRIE